jgi:hypothetical protein
MEKELEHLNMSMPRALNFSGIPSVDCGTRKLQYNLDKVHIICNGRDMAGIADVMFTKYDFKIMGALPSYRWKTYITNMVAVLHSRSVVVDAVNLDKLKSSDKPKDELDKVADALAEIAREFNNHSFFSLAERLEAIDARGKDRLKRNSAVVEEDREYVDLLGKIESKLDDITYLLVFDPQLVIAKDFGVFDKVYVNNNGVAEDGDSLYEALYSSCDEPHVLGGCYHCPKIGACTDHLLRQSGLERLADSSKISAKNLYSCEVSNNDVVRKHSSTNMDSNGKIVYHSNHSKYLLADFNALYIAGEYNNSVEGKISADSLLLEFRELLTNRGFTYVKPGLASTSDDIFQKVYSESIKLSPETIKASKEKYTALQAVRADNMQFRKDNCKHCIIQEDCNLVHNGSVAQVCRDKIKSSGISLSAGGRQAVQPVNISMKERALRYAAKLSRNKEVYRAICYFSGANINNAYGAHAFTVSGITHRSVLEVSNTKYCIVDRGSNKIHMVSPGGVKEEVMDSGYNSPIHALCNTGFSILNSSKVLTKNFEGWVARLVIESDGYIYNWSGGIYIDLDIALAMLDIVNFPDIVYGFRYEFGNSAFTPNYFFFKEALLGNRLKPGYLIKNNYMSKPMDPDKVMNALHMLEYLVDMEYDEEASSKYIYMSAMPSMGMRTNRGGFGAITNNHFESNFFLSLVPGKGSVLLSPGNRYRSNSNIDMLARGNSLCLSTIDSEGSSLKAGSAKAMYSVTLNWASHRGRAWYMYSKELARRLGEYVSVDALPLTDIVELKDYIEDIGILSNYSNKGNPLLLDPNKWSNLPSTPMMSINQVVSNNLGNLDLIYHKGGEYYSLVTSLKSVKSLKISRSNMVRKSVKGKGILKRVSDEGIVQVMVGDVMKCADMLCRYSTGVDDMPEWVDNIAGNLEKTYPQLCISKDSFARIIVMWLLGRIPYMDKDRLSSGKYPPNSNEAYFSGYYSRVNKGKVVLEISLVRMNKMLDILAQDGKTVKGTILLKGDRPLVAPIANVTNKDSSSIQLSVIRSSGELDQGSKYMHYKGRFCYLSTWDQVEINSSIACDLLQEASSSTRVIPNAPWNYTILHRTFDKILVK